MSPGTGKTSCLRPGWREIALRRLLIGIEQGWSPVAEERTADEDEWAVLKLSAVKRGRFIANECKALPEDVAADPRLEIRRGDVLLTRANTPELVGDTCYVASTPSKRMLSDLIYRLHPHGVDRRFLVYAMLGDFTRGQIMADARGSSHSMVKVSQSHIRSWTIMLPDEHEQRRIADFLDRKTAAIDTLIAKQEQLLALLSEKRQALITDRVTPDDTACPHWKRTRLAWVIREVRRPVDIQPATQYAEIGVRSHGRGTFHKEPVFGWELGEKKVYWVEPGDLVFNIVFAWERAVAVVQEADRGRIASHRFPTYRAVNEAADVRFLRYLFMSDYGRFLLDQNSPGAAGRNRTLDRSSLLKEEVLLPPVEEQRRIAIALDNALRVLDRTSEAVEQQLARLREYRQALITAAVTGQLDVTSGAVATSAPKPYAETVGT